MHFTTCNRTSWFQVWHGTNRFYRVAFIFFNGFGCLLLCNISFIMADRSDKELLIMSHFIRKNKEHFFKSSTKFILASHILNSHLIFTMETHIFSSFNQSCNECILSVSSDSLRWVCACVCVSRDKWNNQLISPYYEMPLGTTATTSDRVNDWVCQKMHNISHLIIVSCTPYKYLF